VTIDTSPFELRSARCRLRPVAPDDVARLHEIFTGPGVRRYLWDDEIIPIERTRFVVELSERMFRDERFGLWGTWLSGTPSMIGFAGLWRFRDPPDLELLYGLAESHRGRGYATEVARAVVGYCFAALDMPAVRASTDAGNAASTRVLDRLGFSFDRSATVGGIDTVFYERRRNG
jgi:RimJ/RimL family protein N-acetyltransferase